jgi:hypothetical protein
MLRALLTIAAVSLVLTSVSRPVMASCSGEFDTAARHFKAGNEFNDEANRAIRRLNSELRSNNLKRACDLAFSAETSYDNAVRWYNRAETHFSYAVSSCDGGNKSTARENKRIASEAFDGASRAESRIRDWRSKNCS